MNLTHANILGRINKLYRKGLNIKHLTISRRTLTKIRTMRDANGNYLYNVFPTSDSLLCGEKVVVDNDLPVDRIDCVYEDEQ